MAYGDYEHCPICDAALDAARLKYPGNPWGDGRTFPGYKLLYLGDRDTPDGMVVLCKEHALALKPHIDALIEQAKK